MWRTSIDYRVKVLLAIIALVTMDGCADTEGIARVALLALKVVAGLVAAVVIFLPLMASLATIRAAVRRYLGSRRRDRESG